MAGVGGFSLFGGWGGLRVASVMLLLRCFGLTLVFGRRGLLVVPLCLLRRRLCVLLIRRRLIMCLIRIRVISDLPVSVRLWLCVVRLVIVMVSCL